MPSLNRICLIALILQIGCLALDHSISELEYEEDELRLLGNAYPAHVVVDSSEDNEFESDVISFQPKNYDFQESPVGMPRLGVVRIDNRLNGETVKLISISGNTVNFHSSFFADKIIGPGNSTTFEVVFLSREEGQFESVLFVHTSKGLFKYHVHGVGLPNPYRLRPLVGAKIPVNASYEPIITLHNPHDTRILVVEMLSSGTDFSLKLPDDVGEQEEGTAWAIEPFQTKSVMQGSFQGKTEGNHTGFIRIKVNHTAVSGEYLMVPVEVQVSSSPGIYSPQESLDFGLLVRSDKPKTLSLSLFNAQVSPVNIQSVVVKGEVNQAVRIEFRPVPVEPDTSASTVIALITFDPSLLRNPAQSNGFVEVRSECGKSITIPFTASVLEGELEYNSSSLGFYVKGDNIQPQNFSVRNKFSSAVAVYQVTVNHPDIIEVETLNQSHVITPGEQKTICTLKVQKKYELCDSKSTVQLTVKSNITNLRLPITCYDGKLQLFSVESGKVDFGRVELYSTYTEYIAVQNKNPIEVRLKSWGSNSSWSQVELVGMQKGVMEDLPRIRDFDNLKKSLFLQPGHMAVFSVDIRRPTVEGMFYGESYVTTDQNQTLRSPFKFMVSRGSLSSETIFFDKAFPGKISLERLYLSSTFNHTLKLVGIRSHPPAAVWFSASTLQGYPEIPPDPHKKSLVGKIHFDPRKFCSQDCYTGFSLDSQFGKDWIRGAILNWETGEIDLRILETLQTRFNQMKDEIVSNMSLWVDTNGPTGFKIKAQTRYMWPRLSSQKSVVFPLTSLGNETLVDLVINNPSNTQIVFQAAMAQGYGPSWTNFIQDNFISGNTTEGGAVFSVNDVSLPSSQFNGSGIVDVRKLFQKYNPDFKELTPGIFFIIPPTSKISLNLKFAPISKDMASSLLLLRNNLTGIEAVLIKGRAGTGQLTVGNGTPGSSLLFQLTESLLQGCDKEVDPSVKYATPQVTVRRSFVARNIGEIPLDVQTLMVFPRQASLWSLALGRSNSDGDACEGYGFRILNCHPFTIQPNQTHSIDIAFTPDFTLSKVRSILLLTDSTGNSFNYTLVALIPSNMLARCAAAIARPWWEWYMKVGAIVGSVIIFLAASFVLYFEASGVISKTVLATVRVLPRGTSTDSMHDEREQTQRLDLKAVYDKVENRFRKSQLDSGKGQTVSCTQSKGQNKFADSQVSNLRNRKGKKATNDLNMSTQNGINNKLADKINHNNVNRCNSNIGPVEEVAAGYMNIKKDKEKENIGNANAGNTGKKKKGSNVQSQTHPNGKGKKLQNKIENFNSVIQHKKLEEETSSTTTESSNPDEIVPYPEKERKISNKTANTNESKIKITKREKQNNDSSSNENISNFSESFSPRSHDTKKVYTKKESAEYISTSYQSKSGDNTPKPEMSLWDTPRPPSGEGLSELAAQTEAFVLQRPKKRTVSGDGSSLSAEGNFMSLNSRNSMTSFQMPHIIPSFGSAQQRPRKPGVIGQPRSTQTHSQGNFGSHPHSNSPLAPVPGYNNYPPAPSYSQPTAIRPHVAASAGSIWDTDILGGGGSGNGGVDIWGRRNMDIVPPVSNYFNNHHENTFTHSANVGFVNPDGTYGFNNSSVGGGLPFCPTTTENRYAFAPRMSQQATNYSSSTVTGLPVNDNSNSFEQRSSGDPSYLYGNAAFSNNNNRIQTSPTSFNEPSSKYRPQNGFGQNQGGIPTTVASGLGHSTHGYLQRMRSDPTMRSQQQPTPTSRPPWVGAVFAERRDKEERERNTWVPASSTNMTPATAESGYQDWKAVGPASTRIIAEQTSQIWESNAVGSGRWPSSYDATAQQTPAFNDSMAVGSGSRLSMAPRLDDSNSANIPRGDLNIRPPNSDMTREVEAGLGFNPFTSDIWNQSERSSPSWGSYSYSPPKND